MSGITRRLFLSKAANVAPLALAGTGAVIVPALAAPVENPELLSLDVPLQDATRAARGAASRKETCRTLLGKLLPDTPNGLATREGHWEAELMSGRTDRDGGALLSKAGRRETVFRADRLKRALKGLDGRTRDARRYRRLLPLAEAFEAAEDEAFEASGFVQACRDFSGAEHDVARIARRIDEAEARTLAGLTIKARAVLAVHTMGIDWRMKATRSGPALAEAILAVSETAVIEPTLPPFDYEAAIADLESKGIQLASTLGKGGISEGFAHRLNGVPYDTVSAVLCYRRGFCPIAMGKVLSAQGKTALPAKIGAAS